MPTVTNSIERTVTTKLSERWSVLDFGAVGDGVTDDAPAINDAIAAAAAAGGREIYLPGGHTYLLSTRVYVSNTMSGITLVGDGEATVLKRGASITAGQGVIDVWGSGITFRGFKVDGNVTTSVGLLYGSPGDFNDDPQNAALTTNTSFWVHGGAKRIRWDGVTITHTGGYSILIDAQNADIEAIEIVGCLFENNRPHLFGTSSGDKNYGAWTGGVLLQGDCRASASKLFSVRGGRIAGNRFHRMNGNCVWMHSYGFDTQHENIVVEGNEFAYIARDAFMAGNVRGGCCTGNTARYVGFRHTTDTDTPAGAYLSANYAVGFDAAGYVIDHPFLGNTVVEFYGGAFDLDGMRDSVVANNTATSSQVIAKGLQTGDTSGNGGGKNLVIKGNRFSGCNAGAIVLNQADTCLCEANTIDHPAGASVVPILLFSTSKKTKNTTVRNNAIAYPADQWCIAESDGGSGTGFDSTTANIVYGNVYTGARGEFLKIAASASVTGFTLSTNSASATSRQETTMQREGAGSSSAWKLYDKQGGTQTQFVQLQFSNGLLNVSEAGAVQTGIYTTGARNTLGFKDAMWTGKLMTDGFLAAYDYAGTATSYLAADANALTNDWALLRFNKTGGKWEQSLTTSAGARVWSDFAAGGLAGLTAGRIPYSTGPSSLADTANLTWTNASKVLTVTGATGTAGIVAATSFIQADEGFYTTSTATSAIQAPTGGVTARFLIGTRSFTMTGDTSANAGLSSAGQGRIYFDSTANRFRVSEDGAAYVDLVGSGGVSGLTAGRVPYAASSTTLADTANLTWNNASKVLTVTGATGTAAIVVATAYVQAAEGFYTTSTATSAIQAPSGGVTAKYVIATTSFSLAGDTAANAGLSSAGQGRIYFDSSSLKFRASESGGAYVNLLGLASINSQTGPAITITNGTGVSISTTTNTVTITNSGVTSLTGTSNQVSVSASTGAVTLSLPQSIHTGAAVSFYSLTASDAIQSNRSTGPAIYAPNAYIQAKGFVSSSLAAYNSIQTDAGFSCGVGTGGGYYVSSTQVISTGAQFVGLGVNCPSYGIAASGFNPYFSGTQYYGQNLGAVSVRRGDDAGSGTLTIYGGVVVAMSGL